MTSDGRACSHRDAARTLAGLGQLVVGIEQAARLHRQAAAADAAGQLVLQLLDGLAALLERRLPAPGGAFPVALTRAPVQRHLGKGVLHVGEGNAQPLGHRDQRHPPEHVPRVAPLVARGAFGGDQAERLVVVQRRDGHSRTGTHLADGQQLVRVLPRPVVVHVSILTVDLK